MAAAFRVEIHQNSFAADESCLICNENDTEPVAKVDATGVWSKDKITVISSGSTTRPIEPKDLVHLSCHPSQPYHYKCLTTWMNRNASCPLDRRQINPAAPSSVPVPGIKNLSETDEKISTLFHGIFSNERRIHRNLDTFSGKIIYYCQHTYSSPALKHIMHKIQRFFVEITVVLRK